MESTWHSVLFISSIQKLLAMINMFIGIDTEGYGWLGASQIYF